MKEIRVITIHWEDYDTDYLIDDPTKGIIKRGVHGLIQVLAQPHSEEYIFKDIWEDSMPEWIYYGINRLVYPFYGFNSRSCFDEIWAWDWDENED